jgi:NADPH-dependent 2,4-dienoyl-CoA reductase/sulfur reductase-like enzyme
MMAKREIQCAINPACGHMEFDQIEPAAKPMKVAVVGGGPAGMEAARLATVRGHQVTIFEKTGELGGAILSCCVVPGKDKMKWYADWIRLQIKKLGVEVKLNHAPSIEELKGFDIVLNATGAKSWLPDCVGNDHPMVVPFQKVLACPKQNCEHHPGCREMLKVGQKVLVWGHHFAAVDTAEFLASIGREVTVVTEAKELGSSLEVIHMYVTRKNFHQEHAEGLEDKKTYQYPVTVHENTTVYQIKDGRVVLMDKDFNKFEVEADTVVNCHVRPDHEFFDEMVAAGLPVVNAGDSAAVRNLHAAVDEGAMFGLKLDEKALLFNPNHAVINDLPLDVFAMLTR